MYKTENTKDSHNRLNKYQVIILTYMLAQKTYCPNISLLHSKCHSTEALTVPYIFIFSYIYVKPYKI